MIVPKAVTEQKDVPMNYTKETCRDTLRMLDEARIMVSKNNEHYDKEAALKDLDAKIKKWGMRLTELACQS